MKKKKVTLDNLKSGETFKKKGSRILYMCDDSGDCFALTGKHKGEIVLIFDYEELVTPVKIKISEVK